MDLTAKHRAASGRIPLGATAEMTVLLILLAALAVVVALWIPQRSLKRGPRISNLNNLAALAVAIEAWRAERSNAVPPSLADLGNAELAALGGRTNSFVYFGTNWQTTGILAVEKYTVQHKWGSHWTDTRLGVLRSDLSADFVETNAIPQQVLQAAIGGR